MDEAKNLNREPTLISQFETQRRELETLRPRAAQLDAVMAEVTILRERLSSPHGVVATQLADMTRERDSLRAAAHDLAAAQTRIGTLEASQSDFEGKIAARVRADLCKHGVRTEAIRLPVMDAKPGGEKMTLEQECIEWRKAHPAYSPPGSK